MAGQPAVSRSSRDTAIARKFGISQCAFPLVVVGVMAATVVDFAVTVGGLALSIVAAVGLCRLRALDRMCTECDRTGAAIAGSVGSSHPMRKPSDRDSLGEDKFSAAIREDRGTKELDWQLSLRSGISGADEWARIVVGAIAVVGVGTIGVGTIGVGIVADAAGGVTGAVVDTAGGVTGVGGRTGPTERDRQAS